MSRNKIFILVTLVLIIFASLTFYVEYFYSGGIKKSLYMHYPNNYEECIATGQRDQGSYCLLMTNIEEPRLFDDCSQKGDVREKRACAQVFVNENFELPKDFDDCASKYISTFESRGFDYCKVAIWNLRANYKVYTEIKYFDECTSLGGVHDGDNCNYYYLRFNDDWDENKSAWQLTCANPDLYGKYSSTDQLCLVLSANGKI